MAEEQAKAAVEHLQRAAAEVIAAARATLDLLEELVTDPHLLTSVAGEATRLADTIAQSIVHTAATVAEGAAAAKPGGTPEQAGVQHIKVS